MDEFVAEFNINNCTTHIYNDINVEKGILHFAKSINADIIGMSTHEEKVYHIFSMEA